jgi:hypothetical protein
MVFRPEVGEKPPERVGPGSAPRPSVKGAISWTSSVEEYVRSSSRIVLGCAVALVAALLAVGSAGATASKTTALHGGDPVLVGSAKPGGLIAVLLPPSWYRGAATVTYAWQACDETDCALISYGTDRSLVVPSTWDATRSWQILVDVTAQRPNGEQSTTTLTTPLDLS